MLLMLLMFKENVVCPRLVFHSALGPLCAIVVRCLIHDEVI